MKSNPSQVSPVVTPLPSAEQLSIPRHIAVIMDGNGRWAKEKGLKRTDGHRAGVRSVKNVIESSLRSGVRFLTLFSFSTENWKREASEVSTLMNLFKENLESGLPDLMKYGIRLRVIGEISQLPRFVQLGLKRNIEQTKNNDKLDLILALNYGGREEIVNATRSIAKQVSEGVLRVEDISDEVVSSSLWSGDLPDPDLLIRTSGEMRISNFLLWQLAYSEIVVVPEYWPEFNEETFQKCLIEFTKRERRFGYTSEQIERGEHVVLANKMGYSVAS